MKYLKLLTYSLLAAFALDYVLTFPPRVVRCDGDLIAFEIKGRKVEMFRWLK